MCVWLAGMSYLFYAALDTGNALSMFCLCLVALSSLHTEEKQG